MCVIDLDSRTARLSRALQAQGSHACERSVSLLQTTERIKSDQETYTEAIKQQIDKASSKVTVRVQASHIVPQQHRKRSQQPRNHAALMVSVLPRVAVSSLPFAPAQKAGERAAEKASDIGDRAAQAAAVGNAAAVDAAVGSNEMYNTMTGQRGEQCSHALCTLARALCYTCVHNWVVCVCVCVCLCGPVGTAAARGTGGEEAAARGGAGVPDYTNTGTPPQTRVGPEGTKV